MEKEILTPDMKEALKDNFKLLKDDVKILVFTKKGVNDQYNEIALELMKEIASMEPKIKVDTHVIGDEASKKYDVERSPTLLVSPERYNIRFTGAPLGEEGRTLVMTLLMASNGKAALSEDSTRRLKKVKEKRHVQVFVSPTCPYCPQQSLYAISAAIERSDMVSAEIVEIYENRDIAEERGALSVPKTFINGLLTSSGLEAEEYFMESVVQGKQAEYVMPSDRETLRDYDIVIVGGGPAGLTAAIYGERSGLKCIIFEQANVGGQIAITPVVENYTGFQKIAGKTLVELMAQQATSYSALLQGVAVEDIKHSEKGLEVHTSRGVYNARAVIIATGASYRALDVPGEKRLSGRGVSYCATCDGYLYKDGESVFVIGGGNSALTDALYLDSLGAHVTVVHRRDAFRGEERLQQSLFQRNIPVEYSSRLTEIMGDRLVENISIENVKTGQTKKVKADAVFISVGYEPNNRLARQIGLALDDEGYIKTDERLRTSVPGIYAAGDVTGGVKQIVVAVGQGSIAAITAFEDLSQGN